jgi:hypothetical protein
VPSINLSSTSLFRQIQEDAKNINDNGFSPQRAQRTRRTATATAFFAAENAEIAEKPNCQMLFSKALPLTFLCVLCALCGKKPLPLPFSAFSALSAVKGL